MRLFPFSFVCDILVYDDGAPRRVRSFAPLFPSGDLHDGHRALGRSSRRRLQRRLHRTSFENEVVDALTSLAGSRQAQAAYAGPLPDGLGGPGALSELRVARGYTDMAVHLALLDVGALPRAASKLSTEGLRMRVGKCRPRYWELLRALFEHGVVKFRNAVRRHCESLLSGKKN